MSALLLIIALVITPPLSRVDRIEQYILSVYHGASSYSRELAERIVYESDNFGLDPALLTAIAHTESYFQLSARGTSGERSIWQILPDGNWRKMPLIDQLYWSRHIVISTWRAATIVRIHANRCGHTARCYAHYNSGYARPRRAYVARLIKRSMAVRSIR